MGAQENRLIEMVLLSTHNICFGWEIRKLNFCYALLTKILIIVLSMGLKMCFGCSKQPSQWDSSFEYPQQMFWLRNKNIIFSYTLLSGGLILTHISPVSILWVLGVQKQIRRHRMNCAGPRSAVGNVSGYRCVSDCRSRGCEFDPGPVPYFRGDWSCNDFYGHSPPFRCFIQEGLLSVTSESMCTNYWLTACSSLPRKKCG